MSLGHLAGRFPGVGPEVEHRVHGHAQDLGVGDGGDLFTLDFEGEFLVVFTGITSAASTQRPQTLHQRAGIRGRQPKLPLQEVLQPQSSQMSE